MAVCYPIKIHMAGDQEQSDFKPGDYELGLLSKIKNKLFLVGHCSYFYDKL